MLSPERRTRGDLIVAALIVVGVLVLVGAVWFTGDARGSTSVLADTPLTAPASAAAAPEAVATRWEVPADADFPPVVADGAIVVADDAHTITGRDPETGQVAWSYRRDRELCAMVGQWTSVVAFYRDDRGCGQVVRLDGQTGRVTATRSSEMDGQITVTGDGTHLVVMGPTRVEVLRSDLVRTLEYGRVPTPAESGRQPRDGCTFLSGRSLDKRLALLERCPGEEFLRLTVTEPSPEDSTEPKDIVSAERTELPVDSTDARVIALDGSRTAVAVAASADQPSRLYVYDDGAVPASGMQPLPRISSVDDDVVDAGTVRSWWSGDATAALPDGGTTVSWMREDTLGPGIAMAGSLLVPVPGGITVTDPTTGTDSRVIPVDRAGWTGPVSSAVVGRMLIEQRGDVVVGLG